MNRQYGKNYTNFIFTKFTRLLLEAAVRHWSCDGFSFTNIKNFENFVPRVGMQGIMHGTVLKFQTVLFKSKISFFTTTIAFR